MKFRFDAEQKHQLDAIRSVTDLFEGFPRIDQGFTLGVDAIGNFDPNGFLDTELIEENLQAIQRRHNTEEIGAPIDVSTTLNEDTGIGLEGVSLDSFIVPHFSIEMETGTGKTYVYLRTIRELFKAYGFRKFVVVVPSVAIFEGVKKSFEITYEHFTGLYGNDPVNLIEYDGSQLGKLRDFANNQFPSILLITRDAFNKASNKIFQASDQLPGEFLPFEYIQRTRPIVILDEPQNMTSEKSQQAIRTLNPLVVLRYSATHRDTPNLLYRLTPLDAFRLGLVKQIEVIGVNDLDLARAQRLRLLEVRRGSPITAQVRSITLRDGQSTEQTFILKQGDDLFALTGLDTYRGMEIERIRVGQGRQPSVIEFTDGSVLSTDDDLGSREAIFRAQIEQTVLEHMQRQRRLRRFGVKVLSLFFIDRVDNYVPENSLVKRLFREAFDRIKRDFQDFKDLDAADVQAGYFAEKRDKRTNKVTDYFEDTNTVAAREAAKDAFELIMRDKERLLSFDEPVAFVFAHSALKEGWDNPNVFQICTLNQTVSEVKKRQEIGRGLRLCVDQDGNRLEDFPHNVLTVIANESYERFVDTLQKEYLDDGYEKAPPRPRQPKEGQTKRRDHLFGTEDFREFWNTVCRRLSYRIEIDTDELVDACVGRLNHTSFPEPRLQITEGRFILKEIRVRAVRAAGDRATIEIAIKSSAGEVSPAYKVAVEEGQDLGKDLGLRDLKGVRVDRIEERYGEARIVFSTGHEATESQQALFVMRTPEPAQAQERRAIAENRPIPDILGRAADATHLTRTTLLRIFKGISAEQRAKLLKNPEGWTNVFIREIEAELADHIADRVVFMDPFDANLDAETLFPEVEKKPQHELVEAGPRSLYDKVQIDSDVEEAFVTQTLRDDDNLILFFKFPPRFKIGLPKVIGNYNPDWGIIRRTDEGLKLQLIRETKGADDVATLRFEHEKRKVRAATRYFAQLGIDYRVVTAGINRYWEPEVSPVPLLGD